MLIKYTIDKEHLKKSYKKCMKKDVKASRVSGNLIVFGYIMFSLFYLDMKGNFFRLRYLDYMVPAIFVIAKFTIVDKVMVKTVYRQYDKLINQKIDISEDFYEERTLEIIDNKLVSTTKNTYGRIDIDKIKNVFEEEDVLVICAYDEITPIIEIPTNAFENVSEKNEFIQIIKKSKGILGDK